MGQKKVRAEDINASGTPGVTTYFRGDNTWSVPPGSGGGDPISQITITTAVSITTDTTDGSGNIQKGRNVVISNSTNAINITVNGGTDFLTSYLKQGSGAITFVQGSGRTLVAVNGTAIMFGAVGSTATISSVGTIDYLKIDNV